MRREAGAGSMDSGTGSAYWQGVLSTHLHGYFMLRRFFAYYAPYKGLFFLDFGCAIVAGLLELGFPLAVQLFIDRLLNEAGWPLADARSVLADALTRLFDPEHP